MRVISRKRLREFWAEHPKAKTPLTQWYKLTEEASWRHFADARSTFGSVDSVTVRSGNAVYVFNIKGNDYRLIAAIHFNTGTVYVLAVLTHPEYDEEKWKDQTMKTSTRALMESIPKTFHELNALRPLMPLKDEVDLDNAQEIADRMAVIARPTADQAAYLETLSLLIERYEDMHHAIDTGKTDPIANLRFLLSQHGMNASDLGDILGQRQLGSKVLSGTRQLSKAHIQALCRHFKVGPGAFLKVR